MELTGFTSEHRPSWVMQSLFLIMAFGVWSGRFDAVQEGLAFQANLAHVGPFLQSIRQTMLSCLQIVRYMAHSRTRWVESPSDKNITWKDWIEFETFKRYSLALLGAHGDLTSSVEQSSSSIRSLTT